MQGQMGDTARRHLAAFFALALLFTALPGTSWTAPIDPTLAAGDYALIQVAHGTAGAVAAKATAATMTDTQAERTSVRESATAMSAAPATDHVRARSTVR